MVKKNHAESTTIFENFDSYFTKRRSHYGSHKLYINQKSK